MIVYKYVCVVELGAHRGSIQFEQTDLHQN